MPTNESFKETLDHFRQQRQRKVDELRQTEAMINQLERELGEDATDFGSAQSQGAPNQGNDLYASSGVPSRKRSEILPDEFFGLTQSEAARRYLKKVGHAVTVEDVLESLRRGGCEVGGADPKKTLYISMVRDTRSFIKLPNGLVGLIDFYPDRKIRADKKEKKAKPKKRKPKSAAKDGEKKEPVAE